ncbi:uncharacterized protein ACN427_006225 [Glossina fuscipes fuscipes]
MFEDTLLIIKADYMHRRKQLLIYLLKNGFQIQGQRRLLFSPELAAAFYDDLVDSPNFMMYVILLSKGNSEAYILAKNNAAQDLLNIMTCYFGTSAELDCNVHVTTCHLKVQREISFIFPNYIYEPIYCPEKLAFGTRNPIIKPLLQKLYDITTETEPDHNKVWKVQVADYLNSSNKNLPRISNLGIRTTLRNVQERAQQTKFTTFKQFKVHPGLDRGSAATLKSQISGGSSVHISTSSCVSCSDFGSTDERIWHIHRKEPLTDLIKKKTAPLTPALSETEKEEQEEDKTRKLFRDVQMDVMKQVDVIRQMLAMGASKEEAVLEGEVIEQELIEEEVIKADLHTLEVAKSALEEVSEKPELAEAVEAVRSDKGIAEKPGNGEPVVEQPAAEGEQPATDKPTDEESVVVEHVVEQPAGGESAVEEPASKELAAEDAHPGPEERAAEEPVAVAGPQEQEHAEEAPVEE